MIELTALTARHLETFLLAFFRLGGVVAFAPLLGHRSLPAPYRAALAACLAFVLTPLLGPVSGGIGDALGLVLAVAGELFVGLAIGFVAHLALAAVQAAGELVGFQMGPGISALYDPVMGEQVTVVTRFQEVVALLLFLTLNGHHVVIQAAAASFQRLRPGGLLQPGIAAGVVSLGEKLFRAGLELAVPLVGMLLVLNVALVLLARTVPQTNILLLGLPVTVAVGLFGLVATIPSLGDAVGRLILEMARDLDAVLLGASNGLR